MRTNLSGASPYCISLPVDTAKLGPTEPCSTPGRGQIIAGLHCLDFDHMHLTLNWVSWVFTMRRGLCFSTLAKRLNAIAAWRRPERTNPL